MFPERVLVTGGAGFIGSNLVRSLVEKMARGDDTAPQKIINVDLLTYAGNHDSIADLDGAPGYTFIRADIRDRERIAEILETHHPQGIIHLAAESHVDRSIAGPDVFVETNIGGTYNLLEASRAYVDTLPTMKRDAFRFLNVSTDEVYGSLGKEGFFTEDTPYAPNSPYAATKAAADHLTRAYHQTFGLPTLVTHCSNNYGPYQFPEKLVPLMIHRAIAAATLPIYGQGENIRDWIHVRDHCEGLWTVFTRGVPGETYNMGGHAERRNIEIVHALCEGLEALSPAADNAAMKAKGIARYRDLITFVTDRPGHDFRYAIDGSRIARDLDWSPQETLEGGLRQTIAWYLSHPKWVEDITTGAYRAWIDDNYGHRA